MNQIVRLETERFKWGIHLYLAYIHVWLAHLYHHQFLRDTLPMTSLKLPCFSLVFLAFPAQRGVAVPGAIGHLVAPLSRSPSAAGSVNSALVRADPPKAAMSNYGNLCLTQGCVKAAAQIIENMDPTTNPCSDFYQFACGQWIQVRAG